MIVSLASLPDGLGERASRLATMARMGLPVPAGCLVGSADSVSEAITCLEATAGRTFGVDLWLAVRNPDANGPAATLEIGQAAHLLSVVARYPVILQIMVSGTADDASGSGHVYSRHYQNGNDRPTGVYFPRSRMSAPQSLSVLQGKEPKAYLAVCDAARRLEAAYRSVQEVVFVLESGKPYVLSTRPARLSPLASVRVAVDMAGEGVLSRAEALRRVRPAEVDTLVAPAFPPAVRRKALAEGHLVSRGTSVVPGAASGQVALDADKVMARLMHDGTPQILVTDSIVPADEIGLYNAVGVISLGGTATCAAAQVARRWGIPCILAGPEWTVDKTRRCLRVGKRTYAEGHGMSLDGSTGEIFNGSLHVEDPQHLGADLEQLLGWADAVARVKVYANADSPQDVERACRWGARGVGLVRTENLPTLGHVGAMHRVYPVLLLAPEAERLKRCGRTLAPEWLRYRELLDGLEPLLQSDFVQVFEKVAGRPITVRLLDSPLSASLPSAADLLVDITQRRLLKRAGIEDVEAWMDAPTLFLLGRDMHTLTLEQKEALLPAIRRLEQKNPGFGLRMCRQGIVWPEIYRMELRAIFKAAAEVSDVQLQIMVPGVSHPNELRVLWRMVAEVAEETGAGPYRFGTMIELPRACLVAGDLAACADFFWYGTGDLTQATWGYSTYDAAYSYIPVYLDQGILENNPFRQLDREGVGELLRMATERGRRVNPSLALGICGNQGAEPDAMRFCQSHGIEAISTACRRVPGARLAAAHAAIGDAAS